ncbi:MAG: hypothetical protein K6A77_00340 [Clostridiales bacterium]|nr:hypothetical protein [Clostridiales bacterium]
MKRITTFTLVTLLMVAVLAGCSKSSSAAGTYIVKTIGGQTVEEAFTEMLEQYGDGTTLDDLLAMFGMKSIDEFMILELKEDGTAVMKLAGEDDESGTWKEEGDKVTITYDDEPTVFTRKGNELSYQADGQDYVFIKK